MMYTEEMDMWLAEARREEGQAQARVRAAMLQEATGGEARVSVSDNRSPEDPTV